MTFTVTFEDGPVTMPYGRDLANTAQYRALVHSRPELFPLRFTALQAVKEVSAVKRSIITAVVPGSTVYVPLRFFDGENSTWFDSLALPQPEKTYVVLCVYTKWGRTHATLYGKFPVFGPREYLFSAYDVQAFGSESVFDPATQCLVTSDLRRSFPQIWAAV
jgi:hypothetical protein